MKRKIFLLGAVSGLLTSLVVMAVSYLGNLILSLPFLPFDLFEGITRLLPGKFIDTAIQTMIGVITTLHLGQVDTTAKLAEEIQGLGLVIITGIILGIIYAWAYIAKPSWLQNISRASGFVLWLGMAFLEMTLPQSPVSLIAGLVWLLILIMGWTWFIYRSIKGSTPARVQITSQEDQASLPMPGFFSRRNFLILLGSGLLSTVILGLGLGNNRQQAASNTIPDTGSGNVKVPKIDFPYGPQYTSGPAASPSVQVLAKRMNPAPGTRAEITSVPNFYRVDINLFPPTIDAASWSLVIKGLVDHPLSLSLEEIVSRPAISQALTLSCISNNIGGSLIGTNYWTGVRLKDVLAEAGLQSGAIGLNMKAADGFYESISLTEAMDDRTLLVYAMNGKALTPEHGYPLRIYIPDHYGMKQPKWLTQMEVTNNLTTGYWEDRGWSHTAIPQTTSTIDTLMLDRASLAQSDVFPLGGIAWSGTRGISKVEVQVDQNPWIETELIAPAVSPLTWIQWRYDWKFSTGSHQVRVRATDGTGQVQESDNTGPGPEGATGLDVANFSV